MPDQIIHELLDNPARSDNAELRAELKRLRTENDRLRTENARLRADNDELRSRFAAQRTETAELRATLDAHVRRCRSAFVYGPLELTAGTSVGPRRRRGARR